MAGSLLRRPLIKHVGANRPAPVTALAYGHNQSASGQVVEELLQASCGLVSPDFPLPPALVGRADELVLAVEPGSESGGVFAGGEEVRAGEAAGRTRRDLRPGRGGSGPVRVHS